MGRLKFYTFALVFVFAAHADWKDVDASEYALDAPPKAGSAKYKEDFRILHEQETKRGTKECELAAGQVKPTFDALFGESAGILTDDQLNETRDFVTRVMKYTEKVSNVFKAKYMRPRPYNTDTTLKPCAVKPGGSKAYPSSHASMAAAAACVLGKLVPAKAKKLAEYGKYLGDVRYIVGVHHPSDVEAGQSLGAQVCDRLDDEEDFLEELENVQGNL